MIDDSRFYDDQQHCKTWISVGSVPLHTISKNIEYAQTKSITKYGSLGIKVWLHYSSKSLD